MSTPTAPEPAAPLGTNDLTATTPAAAAELIGVLRQQADSHALLSRSESTRLAYRSDIAEYRAWCQLTGERPIPATPETVALYLTYLASQVRAGGGRRFKPSSLSRKVAAIAAFHRDAGFDSPTGHDRVRRVMAGIRRAGDATVARKWPLLTDDVRAVVGAMDHHTWPSGVKAARDTFAILAGFAGALRRGNVAAIRAQDIAPCPEGLMLRLPRSKTDQEGAGRLIVLPRGVRPATCAPCAWTRWSRLLHATDNGSDPMPLVLATEPVEDWSHVCWQAPAVLAPDAPVLRPVRGSGTISNRQVYADALYRAVLVRVAAAGFDPDRYGFHSLRAGFVTQARRNGASTREVRLQTLHTSDAMVSVYDREFNPLAGGNAVSRIGL